MAHFTTFNEMKEHLSGAFSNFNIDTLNSYMRSAVNELLEPLYGSEVCEKIENGDITDPNIVINFKDALANLTFYNYAGDGSVAITDGGMTQIEDGQTKSPYQWQVRDFKKERMKVASAAMYRVWKYLEANLVNFTYYRDSEERALFMGVPIRGYFYFNNYQKVDGFISYIALRSELGKAADKLSCAIGDDLVNSIVANILAGAISADNLPLMPYVEAYISAATIGNALKNMPVVVSARGVKVEEVEISRNNDSTLKHNANAIMDRAKQVQNDMVMAETRLISYLDKNASATKYAEYYTDYVLTKVDVNAGQDNNTTFRL